ncbi:polysaccharide pyruvyl transferase family protein [Rhodobacter capsulatus]|uniref:Polysaccharide pyruvyl transferase family protein n=2 Tax=Rhodobacter capsulatus TaxID=1061 RepID=A0A4U1JLQ4_RHOCA|nr:polysaccharide pyruvyl transferase family protein [Rhodobacter capsulatus]
MHPFVEDFISPDEPDFETMRHSVLTGAPFQRAVGCRSDLEEHLAMLHREFVGQPRIKFAHAAMTVLLRRKIATETVHRHYRALWSEHADILLETLDSRWLVSACDTLSDLSEDPDEARTATLITLFVSTVKLFETERLMDGPPPPGTPLTQRCLLHDGLTNFMVGGGDMVANLLHRLDRTLRHGVLVDRIARQIISRALACDTVFARFGRHQSRNTWPPHLPMPPILPRPVRPARAVRAAPPGRPRYVLLNDTARLGGGFHLGTLCACHAIRSHLADRGLQDVGWANDLAGFRALLDGCETPPELLVLNGEGTLHHGAPRARALLETCRIAGTLGMKVAVINTVWEANDPEMAAILKGVDVVHVRDTRSRAALPPDVPACVTPDASIPIFREITRSAGFPPPGHAVAVMDNVVPKAAEALLRFAEAGALPFFAMPGVALGQMRQTVSARSGPVWPRLLQVTDLMSAEAWVTGRFHGLIGALCAGRPVCATRSNTAKIEGLLADLGLTEACLLGEDWGSKPRPEQVLEVHSCLDRQKDPAFMARRDQQLLSACDRIGQMFDQVAALVVDTPPKAAARG